MKYLVTGGAGFIGSHIVERLLQLGESVRVIDDFSSGGRENIQPFIEKIDLIEGSVVDADAVQTAVRGVDYVLHHAALPSVPRSVADPIASNLANINGTLNLLVASKQAGVKRLVYASSSSVYGDLPGLPKLENMPTSPLSPYALTKLTGEYYCRMFTQLYGFETVSLRYFNVFGPRQDPTSQYSAVIPRFMSAMLRGERPVIYGDGLQSRDFTFVSNNVDAGLLACSAPGVAGEVLNVACGEQVTLLDLVSALNRLLNTETVPLFEDERPGDIKHSVADISKAARLLNYSPSITFTDGLAQLAEWSLRCCRQ